MNRGLLNNLVMKIYEVLLILILLGESNQINQRLDQCQRLSNIRLIIYIYKRENRLIYYS